MIELPLGKVWGLGADIVGESECVHDPVVVDIAFAHKALGHHVGKKAMALIAFKRLLRRGTSRKHCRSYGTAKDLQRSDFVQAPGQEGDLQRVAQRLGVASVDDHQFLGGMKLFLVGHNLPKIFAAASPNQIIAFLGQLLSPKLPIKSLRFLAFR